MIVKGNNSTKGYDRVELDRIEQLASCFSSIYSLIILFIFLLSDANAPYCPEATRYSFYHWRRRWLWYETRTSDSTTSQSLRVHASSVYSSIYLSSQSLRAHASSVYYVEPIDKDLYIGCLSVHLSYLSCQMLRAHRLPVHIVKSWEPMHRLFIFLSVHLSSQTLRSHGLSICLFVKPNAEGISFVCLYVFVKPNAEGT